MKIFKKRIFVDSSNSTYKNRNNFVLDTESSVKICAKCGKPITGDLYYCLFCRTYYDLDCVTKAVGGYKCPRCTKLNFLKPVKVSS